MAASDTTETSREDQLAHQMLDLLDRLDDRLLTHYAWKRSSLRSSFRTRVTVCFPELGSVLPTTDSSRRYMAWSRSLSRGGLSFVLPVDVPARACLIGLSFPQDRIAWLRGRIVRHRPVSNEGYWEYGVAFEGRAPSLGGSPNFAADAASPRPSAGAPADVSSR